LRAYPREVYEKSVDAAVQVAADFSWQITMRRRAAGGT
jgi:hypothetical protein